jgi:hypothetical protein
MAIINVFPFTSSHALNLDVGQSLNREKALVMLKCCGQSVCVERCDENASEYLIGLFKRGDKMLLEPLLDAGLVSDGALSESLGIFYGDLLWKEPRIFLKALASRPRKEQRQLAWLAGGMDGSGMPKRMLREVQVMLRKIAGQKRNRLSPVARLSLSEVNKANGIEH